MSHAPNWRERAYKLEYQHESGPRFGAFALGQWIDIRAQLVTRNLSICSFLNRDHLLSRDRPMAVYPLPDEPRCHPKAPSKLSLGDAPFREKAPEIHL